MKKPLTKMLQEKHIHGQQKYHAFSFIKDGRKMNLETIDELVDGINYLVYQLIKDRFDKKEIISWDVATLNKNYSEIVKSIPEMSNRSENKNIRAIARMRDLIDTLR